MRAVVMVVATLEVAMAAPGTLEAAVDMVLEAKWVVDRSGWETSGTSPAGIIIRSSIITVTESTVSSSSA